MSSSVLGRRPGAVAVRREVGIVAGLTLAAGLAGYLIVVDPLLAAGVAVAPVVVWLFTHQQPAAAGLALCLPFAQDVTGGRLGLNVAASDLLLVLVFLSVLAEGIALRNLAALRVLRPLRLPLLLYVAIMLVLLAFHSSLITSIKTGQRLELFAVPLVCGAAIALRRYERTVLQAYVLGATVLAVSWPVLFRPDGILTVNKNPAGQFMASAIILLIGSKMSRRLLLICLPLLIPGLLFTLSRGAIVSLGVGLAVLLVVQGRLDRRRIASLLVPLAFLTILAFRLLPDDAQARATTFQSGTTSRAAYALKIRDGYRRDAHMIIDQHRWTGIGVGRYLAGSVVTGTITTDPHEVLLLQQAEGGYPLVSGFVILVVGVALLTGTRARAAPLAPVAVAVSASILSHGLVDVYWVRGTPVLGWLLVGMAFGQLRAQRLAAHGA